MSGFDHRILGASLALALLTPMASAGSVSVTAVDATPDARTVLSTEVATQSVPVCDQPDAAVSARLYAVPVPGGHEVRLRRVSGGTLAYQLDPSIGRSAFNEGQVDVCYAPAAAVEAGADVACPEGARVKAAGKRCRVYAPKDEALTVSSSDQARVVLFIVPDGSGPTMLKLMVPGE